MATLKASKNLINITKYTSEELQEAYVAWVSIANHEITERLIAWDKYVDVRDGLPIGTTENERIMKRTRAFSSPYKSK